MGVRELDVRTQHGSSSFFKTISMASAQMDMCLLPTHPNLFIFIHVIKMQQASSEILVCQADGGKSPPKPKLKYRQLDERICKVTAKHVHGDIDTDALLSKIQHYVNTSKH